MPVRDPLHVLVLGGTTEARQLAELLCGQPSCAQPPRAGAVHAAAVAGRRG